MSILHGEFLWVYAVYAKKNRNSMTITINYDIGLTRFISNRYSILGHIGENWGIPVFKGYLFTNQYGGIGTQLPQLCAVRTSCTS